MHQVKPSGPSFILTSNENDFIVVVGVLHSAPVLQKASYTNLAVYNVPRSMGVGAILDTDLNHSASKYSTEYSGGSTASVIAELPLYAYKFKRTCGIESYCWEVPTEFPGTILYWCIR
jgi:hypothetical protein